jgi:hypothetical protein
MVVFVEQTVMDDTLLINNPGFSVVKEKLMTFRDGKDDLTDKIDFIICLGGDGTLLYASLLFQVRNFLPGCCCLGACRAYLCTHLACYLPPLLIRSKH